MTGLGFASIPFVGGPPNGFWTVDEKGDCTNDDADSGVVAVGRPEVGPPKAGMGGICTRRSGDLFVTGEGRLEKDPGTIGGSLAFLGDLNGGFAVGESREDDTKIERPTRSLVEDATTTTLGSRAGRLAFVAAADAFCARADSRSLRLWSSTCCRRWRLLSSRCESEIICRAGRGDGRGSLYHSPCTGSVCTAASQ